MARANHYGLILAGGRGTRFWPRSRKRHAKQVLSVTGERTLIQATVDRMAGLIPAERTWIVTNRRLTVAIAEQLPNLAAEQILSEPCKRDTAPCIGLAALEVARDDPEAIMAVMPADHVIGPDGALAAAIDFAANLAVTAHPIFAAKLAEYPGVLDAEVHAARSHRRVNVRRVAGKKNVVVLHSAVDPMGDVKTRLPHRRPGGFC